MSRIGSGFFKPGTLFLFAMIAFLGFGMYSWANTSIEDTSESSLENQESALVCSNLRVSKESLIVSKSRAELFFKTNRNLERLNMNFEGEKNVSKTVRLVQRDKLNTVAVNVSNFSSVSLKTPNCDRFFEFK